MTQEAAEILLQRYREGICTPEETAWVENWFQSLQEQSTWQVPPAEAVMIRERMLAAIRESMEEATTPVYRLPPQRRFPWWAAAAVLLLMGASAWWMYHQTHITPVVAQAHTDLAPGHAGALLTLANGQQVLLDSVGNGPVASQHGVQVVQQHGQLAYTGVPQEMAYNTLSTPAGKTYRIVLPDGTQVWLNAASSITYPVAFTGKDRQVSMTGEAYFEVAHRPQQPFRIKCGHALIEDIGTAFNVNAYTDEAALTTTLVEGAVKIALQPGTAAVARPASTVLKPGEQAALQASGEITVASEVDLRAVTAWKDGNFRFNNADIHTIMRQVARWYNVQVIYEGDIEATFSGGISRDVNASELLHILESTDKVRFEISSKTITVKAVK
ncbi:FecR family protein [Chitinophaga costaii]|uniref:FecR family protein n=1 Tax=Chitinophaga costaii TaxID=1335309 RepID=A0A1C4EPT6_9BACT|nr:FecR family protein [Chitinophaga costaii]PUZ22496.1 FecR family protein [Chitinophaga costaii]SCC45513.1 FecR family protein [Chitinophaga costaii]